MPAPSPLKLVLTTTSLRNVTIATPSDEYYYEIVTADWDPLCTKIRRLDSDNGKMSLIAELKREGARSNYTGVRFISAGEPGQDEKEFTPLEQFFVAESTATNSKILGTFTGENGKRYHWQEAKGSIDLVQADEATDKPIAHLHKHHRHLGVLRMSQKPFIEADPELKDTMNTFIVSFLLAEGRRRG